MRLFKKTPNINFVKKRVLFLTLSGLLVLASFGALFTKGLHYGTDFLGGVKLQYKFQTAVAEHEIRELLENLELGEISVVRYGTEAENRIVIKVAQPKEEATNVSKKITPELTKKFGAEGLILEQEESVGPKVGQELRKKGILAVLFSMLVILIYIGFRFDFYFAPGAIVALFHDVMVTLGLFAILQLEFNLTVLAACLTIVGYSINDTIIVFDRVREHAKLITPATLDEVVNRSINETLSRTTITSLTVFFVVLVLFFFGGATIKDFAFAMMIGVITGTYSTFSIATPIYQIMYRRFANKK